MTDRSRQSILSSIFSPEKVAENTYRCPAPHMGGFFADKRLYGGQAVAQAFRALQEHKGTEVLPTTMHYRFCAPGTVDLPIDYSIEEYESVTRVNAIQEEKIIGTAHFRMAGVQFPSYDLNLDYIPEPEEVMPLGDIVKEIVSSMAIQGDLSVDELIYDIRLVEWARNPQTDVPRNVYWARLHCLECVPLNCGLQSALLLSDFFSIQIVEPHDWFLYRVECEAIGQSRAILKASVYDSQRRAVLTVIQEAYADRIPIKKAAKI